MCWAVFNVMQIYSNRVKLTLKAPNDWIDKCSL